VYGQVRPIDGDLLARRALECSAIRQTVTNLDLRYNGIMMEIGLSGEVAENYERRIFDKERCTIVVKALMLHAGRSLVRDPMR
jgi:hypothetical protein